MWAWLIYPAGVAASHHKSSCFYPAGLPQAINARIYVVLKLVVCYCADWCLIFVSLAIVQMIDAWSHLAFSDLFVLCLEHYYHCYYLLRGMMFVIYLRLLLYWLSMSASARLHTKMSRQLLAERARGFCCGAPARFVCWVRAGFHHHQILNIYTFHLSIY